MGSLSWTVLSLPMCAQRCGHLQRGECLSDDGWFNSSADLFYEHTAGIALPLSVVSCARVFVPNVTLVARQEEGPGPTQQVRALCVERLLNE